jgi:hypothetical protein
MTGPPPSHPQPLLTALQPATAARLLPSPLQAAVASRRRTARTRDPGCQSSTLARALDSLAWSWQWPGRSGRWAANSTRGICLWQSTCCGARGRARAPERAEARPAQHAGAAQIELQRKHPVPVMRHVLRMSKSNRAARLGLPCRWCCWTACASAATFCATRQRGRAYKT